MADAVSTLVVYDNPHKLVIKFLNLSDGTGESSVVKVDKSAYTGPNGLEPTCFAIEKIVYDIAGMEVLIDVDLTTDINLLRLTGVGEMCFHKEGGIVTRGGGGNTGDIRFTTNGHSSGDSYDITLYLRKKN